jgi:hypothetical protein
VDGEITFKYCKTDLFYRRGEIMNKGFPTFAAILLIIGAIWLLSDLKIIQIVNIPWIPVILLVVAIGMLYNHYKK